MPERSDNAHTTVEREFESWWQFITEANDPSLVRWKGRRASQAYESGRGNWYATQTFDEAYLMAAVTGWPKGRELLADQLALVSPRPHVYPSIEFDVAGAFPCVPIYCMGAPDCMVIDPGADIRNAKPIIRIDYNHWISAHVAPKDMMLRGAAVVSLANQLEERGLSVELRIVGNTTSGGFTFRYSIVYKRAGEPLDLDRAAFAIAHPSSMRRLAFAIMEQHRELEPSMCYGYGMPMHEPNDPTTGKPNGAIFVPGSRGSETVETAKRAVTIAAASILEIFEENSND